MFKKILISIILFFSLLAAHPHTFMNTRLGVEFEKDQVKGVWVHWEFDEMFSAALIEEADLNRDGLFDKEETAYLYENAFINLENYGYFFYMRDGEERLPAKKVTDFSASHKNGLLRYKFFVPLIKPVKNELIFSLIDPSFFCAIIYVKDKPLYFVNAETLQPNYQIVKNNNFPVYYDPMGAIDDTTVYTKWQKGLMTAYPEEVIVTFKNNEK